MAPPPLSSELRALKEVLESGVLSGYRVSRGEGGPFCQKAEERLEELYGCHALLTTSATTALELALRAVGVSPCDSVIVPGYTMSGTAEAVLAVGATPVLADVDPITGLMRPEHIADVVTSWDSILPPAAIIAVHIHNQLAPVPAIIQATAGAIPIIEDCAQAFYTKSGVLGILAGTMGDIGVLSFKQGKVVHCGEGGALLVRDQTLYQRLRDIRNHGACRSAETFGGNHHMTELQAAVLSARLAHLDDLGARYTWSQYLTKEVRGTGYAPLDMDGGPFIYGMFCPPKAPLPVGFSRSYHTPLCCLPYFKKLSTSCLVGAHAFNYNMIWCPTPTGQDEANHLAAAVRAAWKDFLRLRGEGS